MPNLTVAPFSFLGAGQATTVVGKPEEALADLLGARGTSDGSPRAEQIRAQRGSVAESPSL